MKLNYVTTQNKTVQPGTESELSELCDNPEQDGTTRYWKWTEWTMWQPRTRRYNQVLKVNWVNYVTTQKNMVQPDTESELSELCDNPEQDGTTRYWK